MCNVDPSDFLCWEPANNGVWIVPRLDKLNSPSKNLEFSVCFDSEIEICKKWNI